MADSSESVVGNIGGTYSSIFSGLASNQNLMRTTD